MLWTKRLMMLVLPAPISPTTRILYQNSCCTPSSACTHDEREKTFRDAHRNVRAHTTNEQRQIDDGEREMGWDEKKKNTNHDAVNHSRETRKKEERKGKRKNGNPKADRDLAGHDRHSSSKRICPFSEMHNMTVRAKYTFFAANSFALFLTHPPKPSQKASTTVTQHKHNDKHTQVPI